ncbi:unnamed protein product [Polarella glacialis]|uniref:EF-hand domain-containing protein n=1 Tax=Polarella glacialis TaxID=89957 RepID=A0A813FHD0_POLGL|nr:unnamed protein product [Polarella glacialis]CAE8660811.1 unnamed protein product [Polarella glacialis]
MKQNSMEKRNSSASAIARPSRRGATGQPPKVTDQPQQSVLLSQDDLAHAMKSATLDGRKQLGGLYFGDHGQRLGAKSAGQLAKDKSHMQDEEEEEEEREMDQDEQNRHAQLARVAKAHKDQIKRERKAVKAAKKSGKEEDGRSGKVKNILRGISEAERIAHKSLFDFFDVDKDKTWGSIEFAQRMTDIGLDTSVEAASNLLYFAGVQRHRQDYLRRLRGAPAEDEGFPHRAREGLHALLPPEGPVWL